MELFCADGYYAMLAAVLGASPSIAVDDDRAHFFTQGKEMPEFLGLNNVGFLKADITTDSLPTINIVANVGGLYHVSNPKAVLVKSYELARKYLIVQSVVSLESHSSDYLVSPAPGWTWGNRMSAESFDKMIQSFGWHIIDCQFNVLPGNAEPKDKGSVYYFVDK